MGFFDAFLAGLFGAGADARENNTDQLPPVGEEVNNSLTTQFDRKPNSRHKSRYGFGFSTQAGATIEYEIEVFEGAGLQAIVATRGEFKRFLAGKAADPIEELTRQPIYGPGDHDGTTHEFVEGEVGPGNYVCIFEAAPERLLDVGDPHPTKAWIGHEVLPHH
jgi:hypothetical protein